MAVFGTNFGANQHVSVKTSALSPHFGLVPGVIQLAITTDILDFAFSHSLGQKQPLQVQRIVRRDDSKGRG